MNYLLILIVILVCLVVYLILDIREKPDSGELKKMPDDLKDRVLKEQRKSKNVFLGDIRERKKF